jgi:hypothetical protein
MRIEYSGAVIEEEEIRAVEAALRRGIDCQYLYRALDEYIAKLR